MKNNILHYSVGALLYCPANKHSLADSVIHEKFGFQYSLALCLEDTIHDNHVAEAEADLIHSLQVIFAHYQEEPFFLPKIFIRVRNAGQILRLTKAFLQSIEIVTGFIIPKFGDTNASSFLQEIIKANEYAHKTLYFMPIYENASMINLKNRYDLLYGLKEKLSTVEDLVLNIRVGGNDLCHMFGFRRHSDESIHQIKPVSNLFSDIITVYGMDYIISGPVWEYYSGFNWDTGLRNEIREDRLLGFTGKTVIHPNQIPIVNQGYQVLRSDFHDAKAILNWNPDSNSLVSGNPSKERMNEFKTHGNWAKQILYLAEVYGVSG